MFSASGPAIALLMVWLILPAAPPNIADLPAGGLLDLRPALTNREVMGFTLAYSASVRNSTTLTLRWRRIRDMRTGAVFQCRLPIRLEAVTSAFPGRYRI